MVVAVEEGKVGVHHRVGLKALDQHAYDVAVALGLLSLATEPSVVADKGAGLLDRVGQSVEAFFQVLVGGDPGDSLLSQVPSEESRSAHESSCYEYDEVLTHPDLLAWAQHLPRLGVLR